MLSKYKTTCYDDVRVVARPGKFVYKQEIYKKEIYAVTIEPAHDVSESEHSILINFSNKRTYSKLSVVTTGLLDISKNKSTFVFNRNMWRETSGVQNINISVVLFLAITRNAISLLLCVTREMFSI